MIHPNAKILARGCYRYRDVVREVVLYEEPQGDEHVYLVRSTIANHEGPNRVHAATQSLTEAQRAFHELVGEF
jgi:hypothetical protein